MRVMIRGVVVLIAIAASLTVAPGAGAATLLEFPHSSGPSSDYPNCEAQLQPNVSAPVAQSCYATQGQAIAVAMQDPSWADMTAAQLQAALTALRQRPAPSANKPADTTASTTYMIGWDYIDTHYGGSTFTWTGGKTCSSTFGYSTSSMPSGWNDDVSSAYNFPYSGCGRWTHYYNSNYNKGTPNAGYINCGYNNAGGNGCYNMEDYAVNQFMNDKTSSEQWGA